MSNYNHQKKTRYTQGLQGLMIQSRAVQDITRDTPHTAQNSEQKT